MNHRSSYILDFCFHDIARIHIATDHPKVKSFFAGEYSYHLKDDSFLSTDLPFIELDFHLNAKVPPDYIRHTHKILARWAYRIELSQNHARISVVGNRFSIPMVHHMILHATLRYFASLQGVLMLHSGVVAQNGKSVIFSGRGGTGKTTITSLLLALNKNWKLHADDYVFLKEGPTSLTYQTRLHIYQNLLSVLPELADRFTPWEIVKLRVFGLMRKWSRESIKWPVRLPVDRVWPHREIENTATPVAIIYLEQSDVSAGLHKAGNIHDMEKKIAEMNFYEARHFISLLQKDGILDDVFVSDWKQRESHILNRILKQTPLYILPLPSENIAHYVQKNVLDAIEDYVTHKV